MTTATQPSSVVNDAPIDPGDELPGVVEHAGTTTSAFLGRSSFARLGLETRDVLVVMLGVLLVVAYGPFFWDPAWTPRALLLLAALPFGVYELIRLALRRDVAASIALLLAGWTVVTSLLSDSPLVSLLPATGRNEGAWVMVAALGCWALGRGLSVSGRKAFGLGLIAACALNGVVGIFQVVFDIDNGPLAAIGRRATGLSINPVYFGATMAGAVAWCAWVSGSRASSLRTRLAFAGVGCGSFFITMSGSRVALVAQLVFVAAAIIKYRTRMSLVLLPTVVLGAVLGTALQRSLGAAGSSATDRIGDGGQGPRLDIWKYGWKAFLDRPLTGYGLGRGRPAVQRFFDADFVRVNQSDDLLQAWFESHNVIVQMTVAMGIVGLLLLVAFVAFSLRDARGPLLWAAGAITVTWLLQPARLVTFPLVALLLGASQPGVRNIAAEGRRVVSRAIGSTLVLVSILLAGWVVMADLQIHRATSNASVAASERAVRWSPWDPVVANEAATLIYDRAMTDPRAAELVLSWNTDATELEPDFPYWWMRLGVRQMVFEDYGAARLSFERALDLQPYHPLSLQMLSVIATEQGDDELLRLVNDRLEELGFPIETGQPTAET